MKNGKTEKMWRLLARRLSPNLVSAMAGSIHNPPGFKKGETCLKGLLVIYRSDGRKPRGKVYEKLMGLDAIKLRNTYLKNHIDQSGLRNVFSERYRSRIQDTFVWDRKPGDKND